jgi:transcriptional regulator with XRE-family HTH domain
MMAWAYNMASVIDCQAPDYGTIHSVSDQTAIDRARLVALRKARGWSMTKLAKVAGVDYSSYWRIEKGRAHNPRIETIQRLARALDVSVEELVVVEAEGSTTQPPPAVAGRGTVDAGFDADARPSRELIRLVVMETLDQMSRRPDSDPEPEPDLEPDPETDPVLARMMSELREAWAAMTPDERREARECFRPVLQRHRREERARLASQ